MARFYNAQGTSPAASVPSVDSLAEMVQPELHSLLECWRSETEQAIPGFVWVRSLRPPQVRLGSQLRAVLRGHEALVNCVSYADDGQRIVSASDDMTVRVWDAHTGAELLRVCGHSGRVQSVSFSSNCERIVSAAWDETVRLWDAQSGVELRRFCDDDHSLFNSATSATGNVAIMLRMLGAIQTIAGLTASPNQRRALRDQVQWLAELAERSIESPHDRARFESRLSRVREALETVPV